VNQGVIRIIVPDGPPSIKKFAKNTLSGRGTDAGPRKYSQDGDGHFQGGDYCRPEIKNRQPRVGAIFDFLSSARLLRIRFHNVRLSGLRSRKEPGHGRARNPQELTDFSMALILARHA
jgi:hypothetical protein